MAHWKKKLIELEEEEDFTEDPTYTLENERKAILSELKANAQILSGLYNDLKRMKEANEHLTDPINWNRVTLGIQNYTVFRERDKQRLEDVHLRFPVTKVNGEFVEIPLKEKERRIIVHGYVFHLSPL